jgi:predicted  nucleic acid-binding Zn-ribbon protein
VTDHSAAATPRLDQAAQFEEWWKRTAGPWDPNEMWSTYDVREVLKNRTRDAWNAALLAAAEERERLEARLRVAEPYEARCAEARSELREARARAAEAEKERDAERGRAEEAEDQYEPWRQRAEHLEAALREELASERLACEVYSVPQVDCGHCWGCRVRQALAASGATAIRVRYDSSTGRPLPGHDAAGQQQEGE